jgi:2-haloacid dehalogenase
MHTDRMTGAPYILVFDVNETLIDIEWLSPLFERIFGDQRILREWFNQLVLYSNAITLAGHYETFFALGQGVLQMMGTIYGVSIKPEDIEELKAKLVSMPAHSDAPEGLHLLKEAGFRLMTLTNSPLGKGVGALERAGLAHFFERQFSVDSVRKFKPAREVYELVAKSLNVRPSAMCLVACHTWDTMGAQAAGFSGALLTRPGNAALPLDGIPQPQGAAPDLPGLAKQLIALWRG